MQDRYFDTVTGDYVRNASGGWDTTDSIETALWHQMRTLLAAWWGDATAGTTLPGLVGSSKRTQKVMRAAIDSMKQGVAPLVKDGLAANFKATIVTTTANGFAIQASVQDVQYGTINLAALTPFGA